MLIHRLLRFFLHHLYHGLAFTYDLVAALVSFGQWNEWILSVLPFIEGTRILELGHGPGHLQRILRDPSTSLRAGLGWIAVGLDESAQMGRVARRRLVRAGHAQPNLTRGLGQALPFRAETFDSLVATFPTEYILEARTLSEAQRVLRNGGRLIVLPAAWPGNPLLKWLYRVTGESPSEALEIVKAKWSQPFVRAGFEVKVEILEVKSSLLLILLAQKCTEKS
jgi:ubiquinone/menaquinone biosynthesis C-methylase UbiE